MKFPEKLLHFIWRYKLINQSNLLTADGESIHILDFGQYNSNSGPDFEYAKIQIEDQILIGNIEIQVNSADWKQHKHHTDPNYNATIMHVVWEDANTIPTCRFDKTTIPTLVLKNYIDATLLEKYEQLMQNEHWIACEKSLHKVSEITISNWLDRLVVERLETKLDTVLGWAEATKFHWEMVQLIAISRAFGMKVNSDAFESVMLPINLNLLYKYTEQPKLIEAL